MNIGYYHREIFARNDLDIGLNFGVYCWDRVDYDFLRGFQDRCLDEPLVYLLKVVDVSDLRGLSDPSSVSKPLPTIVGDSIFGIVAHPTKDQETTYQGSCSSFTCITMHNDYVLWVFWI